MRSDRITSQENPPARRDGDVVLRDGSTIHIRVM